jgi:sporulation protein YlmC with PRC-barrel domain
MKPRSANGVEGHLIYTQTGKYMFRVYDVEHNFVDYALQHSDLCVTICDEDAYFYLNSVLDHAPTTLGHEK